MIAAARERGLVLTVGFNHRYFPAIKELKAAVASGATYTNGSNIKASDATAIAKLIEDPGAIFVPADSPLKTIQDFVAAWTRGMNLDRFDLQEL